MRKDQKDSFRLAMVLRGATYTALLSDASIARYIILQSGLAGAGRQRYYQVVDESARCRPAEMARARLQSVFYATFDVATREASISQSSSLGEACICLHAQFPQPSMRREAAWVHQ